MILAITCKCHVEMSLRLLTFYCASPRNYKLLHVTTFPSNYIIVDKNLAS